jgi:signal peptidase I
MKPTDVQLEQYPDPRLDMMCELLERMGNARVRVHGNSMRPFIQDGDIVRVCKCDAAALGCGDIAACRVGDALVVHRVLYRTRRTLRLKGDTFATPDRALAHENLLGRVTHVETPNGLMCLITTKARILNLLVLAYMIPLSIALRAHAKITGASKNPTRTKPVTKLRRIAEWLPAKAANILIPKK